VFLLVQQRINRVGQVLPYWAQSTWIVLYSTLALLPTSQPLESAAAGVGIVGTLPEIDGVNRRLPLIVAVGDQLYPSLAMEILRVAADDSTFQVKLNEAGVEKMRIPKFGPVTTDSLGRIWIDWSQRPQSVSIMNLPEQLEGAIVIVDPQPLVSAIQCPLPLEHSFHTMYRLLWLAQWPQALTLSVQTGQTVPRSCCWQWQALYYYS
jgi:hypothetical protein